MRAGLHGSTAERAITPQVRRCADVPTPYLRLDQQVMSRNIQRLSNYGALNQLGIRPHTKTHKSLLIAQMQSDAGVVGLTTAKVGEAEVMSAASSDLLVAYPCADAIRARRVAELARLMTVRVAIDSLCAVEVIAAAAKAAESIVGVLVDLDVGMHRTGLQSPAAAVELAQSIERSPGTRLDGLFCYPGHIWEPPDRQAESMTQISRLLEEALDLMSKSGLVAGIVSGGSTPTAFQSHLIPQLTEIRPGTYVFNDMNTVAGGYCTLDDCAATVVCTVVSDAVPGKVVIDAGTKTLSSDRNILKPDSGHGRVIGFADARIVRLSEEHGEVDVSQCDRRPRVGERLSVIPNHVCPCVNLQDIVWLSTGGEALEQLPVDARGKLS